MISSIVAADLNGAIGVKDRIPWRLRDDLVRLKKLTLGHTVILGRKSYDSMIGYYDVSGRPMPGKTYIVVSRDIDYVPAHNTDRVAHSIDEAMAIAHELGDEEILVIGGGEIYKATLPLVDRVYLTQVQTKVSDPDAYFPTLSDDEWAESSRTHHPKDDRNEYDHDVIVYERRK